jgi:glycosyltransferase involved in cell wall biosynthesis
MSDNPKYTIAVCNYNMAHTLEESLRSVLNQLEGEDRFEVLVIDDGSTDGSQEILDKLEDEYGSLRWIKGENNNLAEAKNQATEEAEGEHIIHQVDCDDKYETVFKDLVEIYEQLRENVGKDFYLDGRTPIGPRDLLLEVPHRSMGYGEDIDLALRLGAEDKIIPFDHNQYHTSLGYDYTLFELHKIAYEVCFNYFIMGFGLREFLKWRIEDLNLFEHYFQVLISPIAYLHSMTKNKYSAPSGYTLSELKNKNSDKTLADLEEEYEFEFDKSRISKKGKEIFIK